MSVNPLIDIKLISEGAILAEHKPIRLSIALDNLVKSPLIKFTEAYLVFIDAITAEEADSFDYWLTLVNEFVTLLGPEYQSKLELMYNAFKDVLGSFDFTDTDIALGNWEEGLYKDPSFSVALAIRLNSRLLNLVGEEPTS